MEIQSVFCVFWAQLGFMKISVIVAHDENRLIGSGSGIPWHLPRDTSHFRDYTAGKSMLLGRRTFEEMSGWFTSQFPIIVTRNSSDRVGLGGLDLTDVGIAHSVEEGIAMGRDADCAELVVSGGAQIYALALPFATELLVTEVHGIFEGDAFFPAIPADDWNEIARERFEADEKNSHAMSFVRYLRR